MNMSDIMQLKQFLQSKDWAGAHALLDQARGRALTFDDKRREVFWHAKTLEYEQRYQDALTLLRKNMDAFRSQCLARHNIADNLDKLGRRQEAIDELSQAPFEEEIESFYGLALDAKFVYFYLRAKNGDASVRERLDEIPDDYRHITMDGKFLTKSDIVSSLN